MPRLARSLAGVLAATVLAGCAAGGASDTVADGTAAADGTTTSVRGVTLRVPEGWEPADDPDPPGVVTSQRWAPERPLHQLQLVVGCGGTVDELVERTLRTRRGSLVPTEATEASTAPAVAGLETVRQVEVTFGAGRADDRRTATVSGLYGQVGDTLLLVELTTPSLQHDDARAEAVLGSVEVDGDTLRHECDNVGG